MKVNIRCICKKCINDFIVPIVSDTKFIECSKCKEKYDISNLSSLVIKINKELLLLKKHFYTIYTFSRIEIEQDYKLSISDKYSSTDSFISETIEIIKKDIDTKYLPMPRLDLIAYIFVQPTNNDDFILYNDDINPNLYRFARGYKIGASFKEAINMPYDKPFFEDTEFKDVQLYIFSNLAYFTSLYNGFYHEFSRKNPLVFYPFLLE